MKIWFTSDTHFQHKNIIKYCNRPFNDVDTMDYVLAEMWNNQIGDEDVVFHVGDFSLCGPDRLGHIIPTLKGKKVLVHGNHDRGTIKNHEMWKGSFGTYSLKYKGISVRLQHHPFQPILNYDENKIFVHGHCHGNLGTFHDGQVDVGVDCWSFCPVEFDELVEMHRERFGNK